MAAYMLMRSDEVSGMAHAREVTWVTWSSFKQLLCDWEGECDHDHSSFGRYVMEGNSSAVYSTTEAALIALVNAIVNGTSLIRSWDQFEKYIGKHNDQEDLPSVYATLANMLRDCTDCVDDVKDDYTFMYMKTPDRQPSPPAYSVEDTRNTPIAAAEPKPFDPCFI